MSKWLPYYRMVWKVLWLIPIYALNARPPTPAHPTNPVYAIYFFPINPFLHASSLLLVIYFIFAPCTSCTNIEPWLLENGTNMVVMTNDNDKRPIQGWKHVSLCVCVCVHEWGCNAGPSSWDALEEMRSSWGDSSLSLLLVDNAITSHSIPLLSHFIHQCFFFS